MGIKGPAVIEALASRFPQLYVAPAQGAQSAHGMASRRGQVPENATLDHFVTTDDDELREVATPAGPVEVVFLKDRSDFETFLQIIGHKAQPVPIARTIGAVTYRGLADWDKVEAARQDYLAAGGEDWASEFMRLARQPGAFRSELIIISEGPYSNVPARETGYDDASWILVSREVRLHHECSHVVCRRTMPDDVLPVWDEVTADVVGLVSATGRYDSLLAKRLLGVSADGYTSGRLAEYLDDDQLSHIDDIAREVAGACEAIEATATEADLAHPFDYLLSLKASPLVKY